MRSLLILAALLVPAASAHSAPQRTTRSRPAAAPRQAAPVSVRALSVYPPAVVLDGPDAEQRLLITGQLSSGAVRDLTGSGGYRTLSSKVAQVSPEGLVRPAGDGSGWIEVAAAGKKLRVPVRVRGARVERPVSFVRDVMPVLGKAGCNSATCHAKQGGKNGFQLSVLAFDPEADHTAIVRQAGGRRVDRQNPGASLLLRKATLSLPHGGGERFKVFSPEYRLLARWIAEGARFQPGPEPSLTRVEVTPAERVMAPGATQQLLVTAVYSDGSRRDVTALSQFRSDETSVAGVDERGRLKATNLAGEAAVMARFMGQVGVARVSLPLNRSVPASAYAALPRFNFIDDLVYRKLAKLNVVPSGLCDDATFLRRAYLDLIGTLPTADETREFLARSGREKNARADLVNALLERPEYADYWGMRWSNLLLVNPDLLLPRGAHAFDQWLRRAFRANMPFDEFAREILTASGETYREGPPNFFRALSRPAEVSKSVSQLFLGVRLDCAQCHHHPFERWGQDDFYSLAAFFGRVKEKSSYPEGYMSIIYPGDSGEVEHPKTGKPMPPRPLGGEPLPVAEGEDRREVLARWLTAADNPYFARAIVNRMWGLLMGRGIVEPVDDFRVTNPASNEPLLDALAKDFTVHGCDLKHLLRTITASAAYQRSSASTPANVRDTRNYSRYYKKRLPAEVLLDAVDQVTGVPESFRGYPAGTRALDVWDSRLQVEFLDTFGRPGRQTVCECERSTEGSVPQALHLMNSGEMQERLTQEKGAVARLAKSDKPEAEVVTELYLAAFNRYPSPDELAIARKAFAREKTTRAQAIEDLTWALLNSAEFILNH